MKISYTIHRLIQYIDYGNLEISTLPLIFLHVKMKNILEVRNGKSPQILPKQIALDLRRHISSLSQAVRFTRAPWPRVINDIHARLTL